MIRNVDLGTPLHEVTFVVLDLETTGTSPVLDRITEIGACKVRGGEMLGRFETLIDPGVPIPPTVTFLTGITEAMVYPAPPMEAVLASFLEFVRDAVIVGHNIRFDRAFLDAALVRHGYARLTNRFVDTIGLARRLVVDEVENLRLHTLTAHFRTETVPVHRAYADAAATTELFHALLERASAYAVFGLDDLLALPSVRAHSSSAKLALTAGLPRAPGVFWFMDRAGTVLYVGRAVEIRGRVRTFFSGTVGRAVPQLLREVAAIGHRVCAGALEASVRELRMITALRPRFNRAARPAHRPSYLKLTRGARPRLQVVRSVRGGDELLLGPFRTPAAARFVRDAIAPLSVDALRRGCGEAPELLLDEISDRARWHAVAAAIHTRHTVRTLRETARLELDTDEGLVEIREGNLMLPDGDEPPPAGVEELLVIARWLARTRGAVKLVRGDGVCASALPGVPLRRPDVPRAAAPRAATAASHDERASATSTTR
jgi:DNA polymerase III epsilon subunit family exonuclease